MDTGCVLMAIVKCKICGEEIEETIPKCPRCDSLGPKRGKKIKLILLGVMILIVIGFAAGYYAQKDEVEKPYEEVLKEKLDEKLQRRATAAALLLGLWRAFQWESGHPPEIVLRLVVRLMCPCAFLQHE